jgi:hypothetical protein
MADEFAPGVNVGNPSGFIAGKINDGVTSTAALRDFRQAGGAMRTQTWYRLYGEVTDALARAPQAASLDPYQLPDPSAYATWAMGPGGQYVTSVTVQFRDKDTGALGSKQYLYKTDEPHTPAEAQAAAFDEYSDPDNIAPGGSGEGQIPIGTMTKNIYVTVPWNQ